MRNRVLQGALPPGTGPIPKNYWTQAISLLRRGKVIDGLEGKHALVGFGQPLCSLAVSPHCKSRRPLEFSPPSSPKLL